MANVEVDDAAELSAGQGVEDDDVVQAVEELGAEMGVDEAHDLRLGGLGDSAFLGVLILRGEGEKQEGKRRRRKKKGEGEGVW